MTYTTQEAATMSGLTLRQLQWWDEKGFVKPKQVKHARQYSEWQVEQLRTLSKLRRIGVSPRRALAIMRGYKKAWLVIKEGQQINVQPFRMSRAIQKAE